MNNFSLLTADRVTHLKIVVVSLICATLVAGIGVTVAGSPPPRRPAPPESQFDE